MKYTPQDAERLLAAGSDDPDERADFGNAMRRLPRHERMVLVCDFLGYSLRETAQQQGVSRETIRRTRLSGVQHLVRLMNGEEEEQPCA